MSTFFILLFASSWYSPQMCFGLIFGKYRLEINVVLLLNPYIEPTATQLSLSGRKHFRLMCISRRKSFWGRVKSLKKKLFRRRVISLKAETFAFPKSRNIHNLVRTDTFRVRSESMTIHKWRGTSGNMPIVHCVWCVTNVLKISSESYYKLSFASMVYQQWNRPAPKTQLRSNPQIGLLHLN